MPTGGRFGAWLCWPLLLPLLAGCNGVDAQTLRALRSTFATLAKLYTWYSERFRYLLDQLAATPDVDGTSVLDNTLIVWGSELGVGWSHDLSNVPFIFAGGASGRLRGGRYLEVTKTQTTRALVTACHALGLTDIERYGSTDDGSGPLPGVLT